MHAHAHSQSCWSLISCDASTGLLPDELDARLRHEAERRGMTVSELITAAERLGSRAVATLDRRHFSAIRPAHLPAFELLP
jgi:hypothetical protein